MEEHNNEFEVISHSNSFYNIFFLELKYRTPHMHKDFEVCILLDGSLKMNISGEERIMHKNDIWVVNPFEIHEYESIGQRALTMIIQMNPSFFNSIYKKMNDVRFSMDTFDFLENAEHREMYEILRSISQYTFLGVERYELKCSQKLIQLFDYLLGHIPNQIIDESKSKYHQKNTKLIRKITRYIDDNYYRKLLLSDIAVQTNLSVNYLSHCFKDATGMSFQQYLAKIRCDKARILLLTTQLSLFDISISCGFSDVKYFKKNFEEYYHATPAEYRQQNRSDVEEPSSGNSITTQKKLSIEASKRIVELYFP